MKNMSLRGSIPNEAEAIWNLRLLRTAAFAAVLAMTVLAGCGYTKKMTLPHDIRTIHVDTFKNKVPLGNVYAYEPGMEIKITNAVIRRLQLDGNLKVLPADQADAILEGEMTGFDQEGTRFTSLERIEEYRLFITVAMRLKDPKTGEVLWEEGGFSGDASFFVTGPRAVSRSIATEQAIERLARNIVDRIVEDW